MPPKRDRQDLRKEVLLKNLYQTNIGTLYSELDDSWREVLKNYQRFRVQRLMETFSCSKEAALNTFFLQTTLLQNRRHLLSLLKFYREISHAQASAAPLVETEPQEDDEEARRFAEEKPPQFGIENQANESASSYCGDFWNNVSTKLRLLFSCGSESSRRNEYIPIGGESIPLQLSKQ